MELSEIDGLAQALFEQTGDANFLFDPDTHLIVNANSTAQRLSGQPVRELLRMGIPDLFRSATVEGWQLLLRAARHSAIYLHSQEGYFLRTANDDVGIPVNITAARLHVRPKPLGLITARDVRRQHEAYNQLRRTEGELRRVLDSVSDCLWSAVIDESGKGSYHYLSEVVQEITGLPSSFFLAGFHRWYDIVHPDDHARWSTALARQRSGESTTESYRVVWPDGSSRWVREKVFVSRGTTEPGSIRLDGVLTDISERKRMQSELHDCEARFRAFMSHSPIMTFVKDSSGHYSYANQAFLTFLQRPDAGVLSRKDSELFGAEVSKELAERDECVRETNQPVQGIEKIPAPSGAVHTWFVTRFTFGDSSGRRFLAGMAIDADEVVRLTSAQ